MHVTLADELKDVVEHMEEVKQVKQVKQEVTS